VDLTVEWGHARAGTEWQHTGKKEEDPEGALKDFRAIVTAEDEKGEWLVRLILSTSYASSLTACRGFKALKQSTKLLYLGLHRPADALKTYTELLTYTKSAVTRNYSEKAINGILDYVGGGKGGPVEVDVLERFYEATKVALIEAKNEVCIGNLIGVNSS
jgi:COP9 signalosome complex subunit 2